MSLPRCAVLPLRTLAATAYKEKPRPFLRHTASSRVIYHALITVLRHEHDLVDDPGFRH